MTIVRADTRFEALAVERDVIAPANEWYVLLVLLRIAYIPARVSVFGCSASGVCTAQPGIVAIDDLLEESGSETYPGRGERPGVAVTVFDIRAISTLNSLECTPPSMISYPTAHFSRECADCVDEIAGTLLLFRLLRQLFSLDFYVMALLSVGGRTRHGGVPLRLILSAPSHDGHAWAALRVVAVPSGFRVAGE